uniref:Uncharacterized protein n=1 Tax=Noccaea caerulescens TaxID=107243 RepID=A0A1J3D0M0_NOCCA
MGFIALQSWSRGAATSVHLLRPAGSNTKLYDARAVQTLKLNTGVKFDVRGSSSRKSLKKLRRDSQQGQDITRRTVAQEEAAQISSPRSEETQVDFSTSKDFTDDVVVVAPRDKVLQACTVTSGLMAASALIIRRVKSIREFWFL